MKLQMIQETAMCPLIGKDRDGCYCNNLTSMNIERVIHYCQNNFKECEIYRRVYSNGPDGIQA